MRVYHYFGPTHRLDGASFLTFLAMKKIPGVECYHFECHGDPKNHGNRDLNIDIDWAADCFSATKDYAIPKPSVFWCSDTHMGEAAKQWRLTHASNASRVYVNIWSDVEMFREEGIPATWLPYAAEPLAFKPADVEPKYDVGFIGTYIIPGPRSEFLETMFDAFPNFKCDGGIFLEECSAAMHECKVVLNHCLTDATNMRVFEAMANGSCLLTRQTLDLADLGIKSGVHCQTYTDNEDAVRQCRMLLNEPKLRATLARNGRELVMNRHTYVHRAYSLLGMTPPEGDTMRQMIDQWVVKESKDPERSKRQAAIQ